MLHVCLQFPNCPLPSWFTLYIKPDQIGTEKKKKKSTLVNIPSSYAPQVPLFIVKVGSENYALRQYYPASTVMLVHTEGTYSWRKIPNMTVARDNAVACVLDGKIYVMGGVAGDESANWGELFDTKTQTWEPLPDPGPELRFSSMIRKLEVKQRKIYVRSNDNKDSVYDPEKGKWNVLTKALVNESMCRINNVYYAYQSKRCWWYDTERKEWRLVKGLSSLYKKCRDGLIEIVDYSGKLLIVWDKFVRKGCHCQDKNIWCALIALEKRRNGHVWGKVEWSNVVLTVPNSYVFLRSKVMRA